MVRFNKVLLSALLALGLFWGSFTPAFAEPESIESVEESVEYVESTEESTEEPTEEPIPSRDVPTSPAFDAELGGNYDQNTVIVAFKPQVQNSTISQTLQDSDTVEDQAVTDITTTPDLKADPDTDKLVLAEVASDATVADAISELENNPAVDYVQPDYLYNVLEEDQLEQTSQANQPNQAGQSSQADSSNALKDFIQTLAVTTNDTLLYAQSYLTDSEWIGAPEAWTLSQTNNSVGIAVLDTGAKLDHEDLADNVVNFYNAASESTSVTDTDGHGTHVAGIVAAATDNSLGVSSLSFNASLLPIKCMDDEDKIKTSYLTKAYNYLLSKPSGSNQTIAQIYNVHVVNISLGGPMSAMDSSVNDAIDRAYGAGILTVCAAGNSVKDVSFPYTNMPSDYETCVSVINLNTKTDRSGSSNYGPQKDISAPGTIRSTLNSGGYGDKVGTSMASPVVAAAAALCFSVKPDATPDQVRYALEHNATDIGDSGWDQGYGWGRLNAYAAVRSLASVDISFDEAKAQASVQTRLLLGDWVWSLSNGSGEGTIDSSGLVAITTPGTATITVYSASEPSITASAEVHLKLPAPSIVWPTATPITYGQTLADSVLSGGSTSYGSFAWADPATKPNVNNSGFNVIYTPSQSTLDNYLSVSELTNNVSITVNKAAAVITPHPQPIEVSPYGAQVYRFNLALLLPNIDGLTGVSYAPIITQNNDGLLAGLDYISGTTLDLAVSASEPGRFATVQVTISSDNYVFEPTIITIKVKDSVLPQPIIYDGKSRHDTAAKLALDAYPANKGGADGVVVSTGNNFPDALAATSLAGLLNYPILLTEPGSLPQYTKTALASLTPKTIIIVGDTNSVSAKVANQAAQYASNIVRLAGSNRIETAVEIYKYGLDKKGGWSDTAIFAYAGNYPDALAIAPYAASINAPIFLVQGNSLSSSVIDAVSAAGFTEAIIVGSNKSVSTKIEQQIKNIIGKQPVRKGGSNRYQTAKLIAEFSIANGLNLNGAGIATGENFPDALAAGPILATKNSIVLLVTDEDTSVLELLKPNKGLISNINVLGDLPSVSKKVRTVIEQNLGWETGTIK